MHLPSAFIPSAVTLLALQTAFGALEVSVESFREGNVPSGYTDVSSGVQPGEILLVSEEPFLDYLIPNNSGTAGIAARKSGGPYILDSTVAELTGGGNNLTTPDRFHVVFEWTDGDPLPFGTEHYGVSWGGLSASDVATLTTRIGLFNTDPVAIMHWFNDVWNYNEDGSGHEILDGHNLTVTLFDSVGTLKEQFTEVLPSGGAEDIFGDSRQFYTALINVSGHEAGDILVIQNEGGNVGYKGTVVARGTEAPAPALEYTPGEWSDDPRFGELYGYGGGWVYSPVLQFFHDRYPWIYTLEHGWLVDYQLSAIQDGLWLYSQELGTLWVGQSNDGWFWISGESRWDRF